MAEIERQADLLSAHKMAPTEKLLGAPASYFYDLDARDEVAIARTLDVPILILHGERDYQVIDGDIQLWQAGLKGIARVRFEEFPALNHLFIAGAGKPGPAEYDTAGHVDAGVVGAIAEFIQNASAHK
jgi:dienelactone hydrolase